MGADSTERSAAPPELGAAFVKGVTRGTAVLAILAVVIFTLYRVERSQGERGSPSGAFRRTRAIERHEARPESPFAGAGEVKSHAAGIAA
jgi:hypothetical protein